MKLQFELIPQSAWYKNLRTSNPSLWDKIRKKAYSDYNHKCGICGCDGRLECHEIWNYDDKNHIQKLDGFIALCHFCHRIKHIGLAEIHAKEGILNFQELVNHFCKVNNVEEEVFYEEKTKTFDLWKKRSKEEWTTDLGDFFKK